MPTRIVTAPARLPAAPAVPALITAVLSALEIWRQRRALARLESHRLDDLGIAPAAAAREAKRPIWDAPNH